MNRREMLTLTGMSVSVGGCLRLGDETESSQGDDDNQSDDSEDAGDGDGATNETTDDGAESTDGEQADDNEESTDEREEPPVAEFSFDHDTDASVVTVRHASGETLSAEELFIRGEGIASGSRGSWNRLSGASSDEEVKTGEAVDVEVEDGDFTLAVVWEDAESDSSTILGTFEGSGTTTSRPTGSLRIGLLQDFTGLLPEYGAQGTTGFYSGLSYKAGSDPLPNDAVAEGEYEYSVGDADLEIVARDTQFEAATAQELAIELVQNEEVDMLYGIGNSGGSVRVINTVVDRAEVPYIIGPAAASSITDDSETCRELVFRASENTAMDARAGAQFIATETDIDTVALFGADDSFGRAVIGNYGDVLRTNDVGISIERYLPAGYAEWEEVLSQAENNADALVGGFTASTLIPLLRQFLQQQPNLQLFFGFATRVTLGPMGTVIEEELGDVSASRIRETGIGPLPTRYHWNQWDNDINDWFVDTHVDTYDVVPDLWTSGAFTAASSLIQAMNEEGEVSPDAVVAGMRGMTVTDTPKGENAYQYQESNNQAKSPITVANVVPTEDEWSNDWPATIQPSEPVATIPADDVTVPRDSPDVTCDLS